MISRQFNKHLNSCRRRGVRLLDAVKLGALPEGLRHAMLLYVVRQRGPVLVQLVTPALDWGWLHACGYLHRTTGESGYTFLHTGEHTIH